MRTIFQVFLILALTSFVGDLVLDLWQKPTSISVLKSSEEDSSDDEEKSDDSEEEEDARRFKEVDLFFESEEEYHFTSDLTCSKSNLTEFTSCDLLHSTNPPFLPPDLTV